MVTNPDLTLDVVTAVICALLILGRCGYRLLSRCKSHTSCHRRWHADDAYMAFALIPLIGRTACISMSFRLNPTHTFALATEADAEETGVSVATLQDNYIASHQLLMPARIFYAMFLWSLKLCLLNFYSRFVDVFSWAKVASTALWWFLVVTFLTILIPTLAECRPINLFWDPDPLDIYTCHRALGNLITMAVFNIITDVILIIFPFPILKHIKLTGKVKAQLSILFSIGFVVVIITILRLPLILNESVSQRSRTMWASIEILCACIVANAAFFFALMKDFQRGHDSRHIPIRPRQGEMYMEQSDPTSQPRNMDIETAPASEPTSNGAVTDVIRQNGTEPVEGTERKQRHWFGSLKYVR